VQKVAGAPLKRCVSLLRSAVRAKDLPTTTEWRALAHDDPHYAIAAWPGKKGRWTEEEFYASGSSDWQDFRHQWRQYDPEIGGVCLEIGCGAGRITRALALDFVRVVGVDVSDEMLRRAREATPDNVALTRIDGTELPFEDSTFDAVISTHVFQHLDDLPTVDSYLREIHRTLKSPRSAMLHFSISSQAVSRMRQTWRELKLWRSRRRLAIGLSPTYHRYRTYRHEQIGALLEETGFTGIELRVFAVRSNGAPHPFYLVRKTD
jgi:ubiquinone/menaquinone biosynthesis C-methylase UbiE